MHKYTCLPSLLGTEISQEMSGENRTCGLSADHGLSSQRGISSNLHVSESCGYLTTIISAAGSRGEGRPARERATAGLQSTSEWPRRGSPPAVNNGLSATCPCTQREPRSLQLDCSQSCSLGDPNHREGWYCRLRVPIWTYTCLYLTPLLRSLRTNLGSPGLLCQRFSERRGHTQSWDTAGRS